MSYLNQAQDPRRRAAALSGTVAIQVALAFAVVTGLKRGRLDFGGGTCRSSC